MTKQEFLNSISTECVVVDIEKYEKMVSDITILTLVRQLIESDKCAFGLSSETAKALKTILRIKGADKK